jgi:hypothetical protein
MQADACVNNNPASGVSLCRSFQSPKIPITAITPEKYLTLRFTLLQFPGHALIKIF